MEAAEQHSPERTAHAGEPDAGDGEFSHEDPRAVGLRPARPRRRRRYRLLGWFMAPLSVLAFGGLAGFWYLDSRLERSPIELAEIGPALASTLTQRAGAGYKVSIGKTFLQKSDGKPTITIDRFALLGDNGKTILSAPKAVVSLDLAALFTGVIRPRRLAVLGLDVHLTVEPDGGLALSAGKTRIALTGTARARQDAPPVASAAPAHSVASSTTGAAALPRSAAPAVAPAADSGAREALAALSSALGELFAETEAVGSQLSGLRHVGITEGRLIFSDPSRGIATAFKGLEVDVARGGKRIAVKVSALGQAGRWEVLAAAQEANSGQSRGHKLDISLKNLTLDELSLASGMRNLPVDFDMPLNGKLSVSLGPEGRAARAHGTFDAAGGYFLVRDRDFEPVLVESVKGDVRWSADSGTFALEDIRIKAGKTALTLGGQVVPPKDGTGDWRLLLETKGALQFAHQIAADKAVVMRQMAVALRLRPETKHLAIERFSLTGPDIDMLVQGSFDYEPGKRRLQIAGQVDAAPLDKVRSLWPPFLAAPVRAWVLRNLSGGSLDLLRARLDFDEATLAALAAKRAAPEGSMDIRYKMSGVTLNYMPGTRPLTRLSAEGRTIGPLTEISIGRGTADLGNGRSLAVVSGKFSTRDMSPRPAPTAVQLRLAGRLADMGAALAQPGLAAYAPDGLDIETMSGKIDAGLDIGFLLTRAKGDARVKASMKAKVSALRIDNFIGKTPLEQGNLDVSIREGLIAANGTGRMFGAPAQISMQKRGSGAMQGSVAFVLDEAARSKLGWKSGDTLKGPVGVKIAGPLGQTDTLRGDISLDLTKAAISGSVPGFDKPAGRPASASFAVSSKGKGATLNNFVFRGGGLAARGVIELGADNSFTQARLSQLKISPGDDLRADIRAEGGGLRIALSGAAIDLRPALGSDGPSPFGGKASTPVTVSVETRLATGFNGRVLSNFKLQLAADGGGVSKFDLNASAGRSAIRGRLLQKSAAGPYIELSGADAGTVLSFLDVYKRMDGGRMVLRARVARDGGVAGTLDVRNFVLRNEPALRKLVAQGAPQGPESGRRFDATLVRFDKLQFGFSRGNGRLAVSDGIISGPEIGLTLDGAIDFSGDRVSMNGTFVPAYALNNVFARIPLFGPLLGGGKNEGLLGVNFRVSGRASAPLLNINPLSAIAPGFLRKIFGVVPLQAQPQARQVPQRLPNMPLSLGPQR